MAAKPELISRTWNYRFTVPRGGWPLTTWAPWRPGLGASKIQVREVRVRVAAGASGEPQVTHLSARGRWVKDGKPAHDTHWQQFRIPGREYAPAELGVPQGPAVPWMGELCEAALAAVRDTEAMPL